jgi:hypothetical protein
MRKILLKIASTIAALVLAGSAVAAGAGRQSSDFARFKRKMMPKVGRKTTVVGALASAKLGWIVTNKSGGVYIYALRDSDAPKMKILEGLSGRTVRATGILRYSPGSPPARTDEPEASVPEHFFFDAAEASVTALGTPRTKRPKTGATRAP